MKKYFIRKKIIAKQKKLTEVNSTSVNVLLLLDDSLSVNQVSKMFQDNFGATYQLYYIVYTKDKLSEESPKYLVNQASFSFFGNIKNQFITKILDKKFCYQFNLFSEDNCYLNYLSSCAYSNYSLGFTSPNDSSNDISIKASTEELDLFFKEAKKYLSIID